jgi:hypothetical protein
MWKYKKLATALGVTKEVFDAGQFDATDHIGAGLVIEVTVESSDQYGDSNKVKGFKAKALSMPSTPAAPVVPRQVTAPKPRPVDNVATARELDPSEIPFSAGDYTFS